MRWGARTCGARRATTSEEKGDSRFQRLSTFFKRNAHLSKLIGGRSAGAGWFFRNQPAPTDRTTLSIYPTVQRYHTIRNQDLNKKRRCIAAGEEGGAEEGERGTSWHDDSGGGRTGAPPYSTQWRCLQRGRQGVRDGGGRTRNEDELRRGGRVSSGSPPRKPRGGGGRFGGYGVPEKDRPDEGLHFYLFIMRIIGSSLTIIQLRIMINRNIIMALLAAGEERGRRRRRAGEERTCTTTPTGGGRTGAPPYKKGSCESSWGRGVGDTFLYTLFLCNLLYIRM